jgi:hypothetical protein
VTVFDTRPQMHETALRQVKYTHGAALRYRLERVYAFDQKPLNFPPFLMLVVGPK